MLPNNSHTPSILIVDDDDVLRNRLSRAFTERGFHVLAADNHDSALKLAQDDTPEFAVVDLRMNGPSGLALLRELRLLDPTTRVVILTGYGSIATAIEAVRQGAVSYLTKPSDVDDILRAFFPTPTEETTTTTGENVHTPSLARAEWEHINRVLGDVDGNISEAARRLGLHRRSLQRKLQKYPPVQ